MNIRNESPTMREILKKLAMMRKCDFKKVDIMNVDIIPWIFPRYLFGQCHNLQLLFWNFSRKISMDKNILQLWKTGCLTYIICLACQKLFVDSPLLICVFINTMSNSAQLEDRTATACFFVNHRKNVFFNSIGMCCLCFFS